MSEKVTPDPHPYPPFSRFPQSLIRSGLWASLGIDAKALFPVLLTLANINTHTTPPIRHDVLRELSGLSATGVKRAIKELRDTRLVDSFGATAERRYVITDMVAVQTSKYGRSHVQMSGVKRPNTDDLTSKYGRLENGQDPGKPVSQDVSPVGPVIALNRESIDIERGERDQLPAQRDVGNGHASSPPLENIFSGLAAKWRS